MVGVSEKGLGAAAASLLPSSSRHDEDDEEKAGGDDADGGFWNGESVKSIVYGGHDAIVDSFSLISSISAGQFSSPDVLVLGIAKLVADGVSAGIGDYLSGSAEKTTTESEKAATVRRLASHQLPEQQELLATYQALGMNWQDASTVVGVFSKYKGILAEEKLATEEGELTPRQSEKPWKGGLITFASFMAFGSVPLLSFVVLIPFNQSDSAKFLGALLLTAFALMALGIAKAKISGQKYLNSVAATVSNGCISAASAYLISWLLRNVAGLHE